jgi:hypothetical protein
MSAIVLSRKSIAIIPTLEEKIQPVTGEVIWVKPETLQSEPRFGILDLWKIRRNSKYSGLFRNRL